MFGIVTRMFPIPPTTIFIFRDFMMFYEISFFTKSETMRVYITYKHGIYELPHELSNDLKLRILGN